MTVNGQGFALVHRSVLERVAEIAGRLGCDGAAALGRLPASFESAGLARLRRELDQVVAFADAARCTGWALGEVAVAPGDRPERVLDTPEGTLWASSIRGYEVRGAAGTRRVTRLAGWPGQARRVPLTALAEPLLQAVARAGVLQIREQPHPSHASHLARPNPGRSGEGWYDSPPAAGHPVSDVLGT
ncbi:hypothetical protein ACA361_37505 [Actinomadura sp. 21ATH]